MNKIISVILAVLIILSVLIISVSAEKNYKIGDVDGNGEIASSDALLALQHAVGKITLEGSQQNAADIDNNGKIDATDALTILQAAVGKTTLPLYNDYSDYEYNYVEPVGFKANTMYSISSSFFKDLDTGRNHDFSRLVYCIQGLINRNNDIHNVAINVKLDSQDQFWLDFMSEEGATYDSNKYSLVEIKSESNFWDLALPFIKQCGIIAWDPDVPATANIASTICGLEGYLPVQYSTVKNSLYQRLITTYEVEEKMSLVGMFEGAKLGKKIIDTNIKSTGSSKCDAYLWAVEKYMDRCNPELLAYTPDGATAVAGSWLAKRGDASSASTTGIPNHDYFIAKQMFFFDLTSYGGESPCDDPTQPFGADRETLGTILLKRYEMAGGMFGMAIGFPPWHLKYTTFINDAALAQGLLNENDSTYDLDPARLEWHFVEYVTTFNVGIEADAAHPCWMSNGSLYYKYQARYEKVQNAPAKKDVVYDPTVKYYTFVWTGDFDCSPWMKARVPNQWAQDTNRGKVDMTYGYNVNLSQRIPMAFDYIASQRTERDYLVGGEGCGYTFPSALWQGFEGSEGKLATAASGYYGKIDQSVTVRTLPDGGESYYNYAKKFFDDLKITTSARVINGFNVIDNKSLEMLSKLSPGGVFIQGSAAGGIHIRKYKNLVCEMITDIGDADSLVRMTKGKKSSNLIAIGYCDPGKNWGTPTGILQFEKDVLSLASTYQVTYQYVDISTFVELVKQSDEGTVIE